jgi:hypothetical protein
MIRKSTPLLGTMMILPLLTVAASAADRGLLAGSLPIMIDPGPAGSRSPVIRTYVSGLGSDSNLCTAASPCATFKAALAMTLAGGEIFVLNSADYGPVTINKAISITSEGAAAGILATSGSAITISAGASDVVNLRGLTIDGANSGTVGIQFVSGKALTIQKSFVRNFTQSGISFGPAASATLFVSDTIVVNNTNNGIVLASGSGSVKGALSRVSASGNGVGILASGHGVSLAVTDAVISNNSYGIGASSSAVTVINLTASANSVGIAADQPATVVSVAQSTITGNSTGWQATNGAQVQSYGNNNVGGNASDGTATSTIALE